MRKGYTMDLLIGMKLCFASVLRKWRDKSYLKDNKYENLRQNCYPCFQRKLFVGKFDKFFELNVFA